MDGFFLSVFASDEVASCPWCNPGAGIDCSSISTYRMQMDSWSAEYFNLRA